ncbi:MAG: hypothetical protein EB141_01265 [Verrucomicrobia bacterium]|nr:hypothetical protein [Verrucomicrobiota bacterium]NBU08123.1 hypothetical protein [Pseudomonadota bacterium]NDA65349.1 hypothetical protein [Verrucomicrobiota bacterium]NDB74273.1 hypothetical protein [Verrucomicrobiota bacterium]NDD36877.1 hypothetical protein [Verrucomicrobiota bacterium]
MTQIQLSRPPANLESYVRPPSRDATPEEVESWIRNMLREAKFNLHIPYSFIATIASISQEAGKAGYRIQFLPIAGSTATADFFLERLP